MGSFGGTSCVLMGPTDRQKRSGAVRLSISMGPAVASPQNHSILDSFIVISFLFFNGFCYDSLLLFIMIYIPALNWELHHVSL